MLRDGSAGSRRSAAASQRLRMRATASGRSRDFPTCSFTGLTCHRLRSSGSCIRRVICRRCWPICATRRTRRRPERRLGARHRQCRPAGQRIDSGRWLPASPALFRRSVRHVVPAACADSLCQTAANCGNRPFALINCRKGGFWGARTAGSADANSGPRSRCAGSSGRPPAAPPSPPSTRLDPGDHCARRRRQPVGALRHAPGSRNQAGRPRIAPIPPQQGIDLALAEPRHDCRAIAPHALLRFSGATAWFSSATPHFPEQSEPVNTRRENKSRSGRSGTRHSRLARRVGAAGPHPWSRESPCPSRCAR